jgi:ribosomal-protein-alanine N-acetyltransferase
MGFLDFFRKTEWRVDPATGSHTPQISAMHSACFARGWSIAEIEGLMSDRGTVTDILRAQAGSAVIDGFALSRVAGGEAELLSIAVSSRRRGKGGSTTLLARHLARVAAAGARRIVLEVDEDNAPALALYRRFGFEEVATRPAYYPRRDGTRGAAKVLARALD